MTDVAQQLHEVHALLDAARVLLGVVVALLVLVVVVGLALWSQQRRMNARLHEREADIRDSGQHAREELARQRLRFERWQKRRRGTGGAAPPPWML